MENQEPNHSTQKEEPVNIPEKPKTMGTPTHPLPKFLPKLIALIVIILIVGVLLSGLVFTVYNLGKSSVLKELNPNAPAIPPADPDIYKATPIPDPTADWKTYTNTLYEYSLKYPDTEFVNCGKEDTFRLYGGNTIESCSAGEDIPYLVILKSLEGTGDIEKSSYPNCYSMEKEPIVFAGISAIKYSSKIINDSGNCIQVSPAAKNTEHIILTQSNRVYNIVIHRVDKEKLVDQILSTFKFTE